MNADNQDKNSGAASRKPEVWKLGLYVAGQTPESISALANLKALCEEHLN